MTSDEVKNLFSTYATRVLAPRDAKYASRNKQVSVVLLAWLLLSESTLTRHLLFVQRTLSAHIFLDRDDNLIYLFQKFEPDPGEVDFSPLE